MNLSFENKTAIPPTQTILDRRGRSRSGDLLIDLAPYLQAGEDVPAVYVKYYGTPKSYWMPAAPNLTLGKTGILVLEANLGAVGWLVSDASWEARKADAWSGDWRTDIDDPVGGGVPIEVFDARRFPYSWRGAGFDDNGWAQLKLTVDLITCQLELMEPHRVQRRVSYLLTVFEPAKWNWFLLIYLLYKPSTGISGFLMRN